MVETNPTLASEKEKSASQKNTCENKRNQQVPKMTQQQNTVARAARVAEPPQRNRPVIIPANVNQEPGASTQILKKPMLDGMSISDDFKRGQFVRKLRYDEWRNDNQQLEARIQQQNQARGGQYLNSSSPDVDIFHYPQQQPPRNQLTQPQPSHEQPHLQSSDDDMYSSRLKEYIRYLRKGIKNNTIIFWRKFVSLCYANCGRERWCVSLYENIRQPLPGNFSFTDMDPWCCDLCGATSGKGFEASYEILPRLLQMRYEGGELDQNFHLDSPGRHQLKYGAMLLEYGKAVLETTYEHFCVFHEGRLRVIFRKDLKILSWQFCAQRHEVYLTRQLVVPQVNQLIDASYQYQSSLYDCAQGNVSEQPLLADSNMCKISGQQLTSFVELPLVNDLGFSAKHGRCLEVAKVVNVMKDLMDFSFDRKTGPIESLQTYPRAGNYTNMWINMQTESQQTTGQGSTPYGVVFNGSGQDRSRFHVSHRGFQQENPLNTMQSASISNYELDILRSQSGQHLAFPYPTIQSDNNPGSVNNSS